MSPIHWQPSASIELLRARADFIYSIRDFFRRRNVLEIQAPILSQCTITAPYIESFATTYYNQPHQQTYYLQTSPEYAMKRLLAAGSGPIFAITPAFRNEGEQSEHHNPEFTLLEWYRPGFTHHDLMVEVSTLLQHTLGCPPAEKISYQQLFLDYLRIDPLDHEITVLDLHRLAEQKGIHLNPNAVTSLTRDDWLQLLLSHLIEPSLGQHAPLLLYDYPATQAALAKLSHTDSRVAERFEVYIQGMEIGNGFHELCNSSEQRERFAEDQATRHTLGKIVPEKDERLLAALEHGFPACSGIAIGLDRLFMLKMGTKNIAEVLPFAWSIA